MSGSRPVSILFVDDNDLGCMPLLGALSKEGWAVTEAANGREALERLAEAKPELILLDLMMPEMDGFEFLTEVRRHPDGRSIPVVVLTAKDITPEERLRMNGSVEKTLQKGAYGREELLGEVRSLVAACIGRKPAGGEAARG